jgi:hypothetical protein
MELDPQLIYGQRTVRTAYDLFIGVGWMICGSHHMAACCCVGKSIGNA